MHRNTVKTLQSAGFKFNILDFSHTNPVYEISFGIANNTIKTFSKLYSDPENTQPFIAITTCASADKNCPFIPEAAARLHLPYMDPKVADGTPQMEAKYLATNKEIAAELFYVFEQIKARI
jgi:arsenate reductase